MNYQKAKDYISLNRDILISPIKKSDIKNLAVGTLLFYVNTGYRRGSASSKPQSLISSAGYGVVTGVKDLDFEPWVQITAAINKGARSLFVKGSDLDDEIGTTYLFKAQPLPLGDSREQVSNAKFWAGPNTETNESEG